VPGHYYGLLPPTDNYILTTNQAYVTAYFSSALPATLVFKLEDRPWHAWHVVNRIPRVYRLLAYETNDQAFDSLFYIKNAKLHRDLQPNAFFIDVDIKEQYAIEKDGKHL
jgi:hypothetical protein